MLTLAGVLSTRGGVPEHLMRDWQKQATESGLVSLLLCLVYGSKTAALTSNITSTVGMVSSTAVGVWADMQEHLLWPRLLILLCLLAERD